MVDQVDDAVRGEANTKSMNRRTGARELDMSKVP